MPRSYLVSKFVFVFIVLLDAVMADIVIGNDVSRAHVQAYWVEMQAVAHLLGVQVG